MVWSTPCFDSLVAAAESVGLRFLAGRRHFVHRRLDPAGLPDWFRQPEPDPVPGCDHVLAPPPDDFRPGRRVPNEVGVFAAPAGGHVCVADLERGGFGLEAYVGRTGDRFRQAYGIAVLRTTFPPAPDVRHRLLADGTYQFTYSPEDGMTGSQSLQIKISPAGVVSIEAVGFAGPACQAVVDELLRKFGRPADTETVKPEFFAAETEKQPEGV